MLFSRAFATTRFSSVDDKTSPSPILSFLAPCTIFNPETTTMPSNRDPRKVKGSRVFSKATFVLHKPERLYGPNHAPKLFLEGEVIDCWSQLKPNPGGRSINQTWVKIEFDLGGNKGPRLQDLLLCNVKVAPPDGALVLADIFPPQREQPTSQSSPSQAADLQGVQNAPPGQPSPIVPVALNMDAVADSRPAGAPPAPPQPQADSAADPSAAGAPQHGRKWVQDDARCKQSINTRPTASMSWSMVDPIGNRISENSRKGEFFSKLDAFLLMLPPDQLALMVQQTNLQLQELNDGNYSVPTTKQELLKFIGILILMTKFSFEKRSDLWSTSKPSKYEDAPDFGTRVKMTRRRFDNLWRCLRYSHQPKTKPANMTGEAYRWMLVEDFVKNFNAHHASQFIPSFMICVDESISRWYGHGGDWINMGLPMYVALDRKPENGCEIQDACDGMSGIMLRLKLVKSKREEMRIAMEEAERLANAGASAEEIKKAAEELHGTKILKYLTEPWSHSHRIVCGDSYFASVTATEELLHMGMYFIGVVKTATSQFPKAFLENSQLSNKGDCKGCITKNAEGDPEMMAFVWLDRDRRMFITSCSSLKDGTPMVRHRWRQPGDDVEGDPTFVEETINQPEACELYYYCCSMVDRHNRHRQQVLDLEKTLKTHRWDQRVNMSILAMIIVDAWLIYSQALSDCDCTQAEFYGHLAAELIDNTYGQALTRASTSQQVTPSPAVTRKRGYDALYDEETGLPRHGLGPHLTPTKRKREIKRKGDPNNPVRTATFQGRCKEGTCRDKTILHCSVCWDQQKGQTNRNEFFLCLFCFPSHFHRCHCDYNQN